MRCLGILQLDPVVVGILCWNLVRYLLKCLHSLLVLCLHLQVLEAIRTSTNLCLLISEYKMITDAKVSGDFNELNRVPLLLENGVDVEDNKRTKIQVQDKLAGKFFGIFRTPVEFVNAALQQGIPLTMLFRCLMFW